VNFFDNFFIHPDTFSTETEKDNETSSIEDFLSELEEENKLPIRLKISNVGRDGLFSVKFNQKLAIPAIAQGLAYGANK